MFETTSYEDPFVLDPTIRARWAFMETSAAAAVLRSACPAEWADIMDVLRFFQLDPKYWLLAGGDQDAVTQEINRMFSGRGWRETRVDLSTQGILLSRGLEVMERLPAVPQEGYLVDNFKGRVALDVEWNASAGNLDRDLSAYRAWHKAGVISAAVLITQDRVKLKQLAEKLWFEYQEALPEDQRSQRLPIDLSTSTTTNLEQIALRVRRGVMGRCPLLVVAATPGTWNQQPYSAD